MFKDYESRPVTRRAYEIQSSDEVQPIENSTLWRLTVSTGEKLEFAAHSSKVEVGDFVVFLNDKDIYHCARDVFLERNIVDSEHGAEPPRHSNSNKRLKAIELAKAVAYERRSEHEYLPKTEGDFEKFEPHEWVIDAILRADQNGFKKLSDINAGY